MEKSRADLEIRSVLGDVTCSNLAGACEAKLIQGSLTMTNTCTSNLNLSTKRGKIVFDGMVMGGMSYYIKSDSGDVEVSLEGRSDCGMTVDSEEGSITWTFFNEETGESETIRKTGRNSIYLPFRRGSGGMYVMSKSGQIVIKRWDIARRGFANSAGSSDR